MAADLTYKLLQGTLNTEVQTIVYHSKHAKPNALFVCIQGVEYDGHDFAEEAVEKGAVAVLCSKPLSLKAQVAVLQVEDCRKALALLAATFYHHPAKALYLIGITGTKGKTTTAYMLKSILDTAGIRAGLIGTVEMDTGCEKRESRQTTPEALELHACLREMVENGCKVAVMEVSSQAIKQHRVYGLHFDVAILTNVQRDHIGPREHKDFEEYIRTKAALFAQCKCAILNGDEAGAVYFAERYQGHRLLTYGMTSKADLQGYMLDYVRLKGKFGVEFQTKGLYNIILVVPAAGSFSAYNAMAALLAAKELHIDDTAIQSGLSSFVAPGRQEVFSLDQARLVMVDYAHNGMALSSLLQALRQYHPTKITCVFGCGGERDPRRREEMGEAAAKWADFSIITADNPRNESPSAIISDIIYKIECFHGKYCVIEDRRQAIRYAVAHSMPGEIVLIAGKGHEHDQIIGNCKIHFDDREEVRLSIEKVRDEQNYNRRN